MMPAHYANPDVRARIVEFLGGPSLGDATSMFLTAGTLQEPHHRRPRPVADLPRCFEEGLDISRSLWDREALIAHLDVEYVNFDFPAEPFLDPQRIFEIQNAVEWTIEEVLLDFGIVPLHLLSGRGHHFVWQIRQDSHAFARLAVLGRVSPKMREFYAHPPSGEPVPLDVGAAFAGLGLVMEFVAARVKELAAPQCPIPVELSAVEVGPSQCGRELVSIDITEYGDPLNSRVIRAPFSLYLKPYQQRLLLGEAIVEKLPPVFMIPLHEMDSHQGIRIMNDIDRVAQLASRASAKIPDQSEPMEALISAYMESSTARFHDWFYSQDPHPASAWPDTYDRMPMDVLPLCVRHVLENPNDLLLRPGFIERVVRTMLSLGWHPRHIAGLMTSKFERHFHWGDQWRGYEPGYRADFFVRIFTGLFVTGRDDLIDFNCQSGRETHLCFNHGCAANLHVYRESLLERRTHERLACRPFNGLFLPAEHL